MSHRTGHVAPDAAPAGPPAAGPGELRWGPDTAATLARDHDEAAAAIGAATRSLPATVDAGPAGPLLSRILNGVAAAADDLAFASAACAALVGDVETAFGDSDRAVAAGLGELASVIS